MTENDLGRALLRLGSADLSGVPDVQQQTWRVLEADRRRVRRLTALTIVAWLVATAMILFVLVAFGLIFPMQAQVRMDLHQGKLNAAQAEAMQVKGQIAFQMGTVLIAFSVTVLAAALLCTVLLNLATRRATLRQINASLVEISAQLKALRPAGS